MPVHCSDGRKGFVIAALVGPLYAMLTEHEKIVINFIADKGETSVSDAMRLIGRDWHSTKVILDVLVERRILELRKRSGKERESSKRYHPRKRG
jgi:ATP-dependent DNA helicase RecG